MLGITKKKKSVKMSLEDYERLRDTLLEWNWLTKALDYNRNKFTYQPTELGVSIYSAIVQLVGRERLVNGYKLDVKKMEGIIVSGENIQPEVTEKLLQSGILVQTYNPATDENKYELSMEGSKLFVAFFVSYNREVGTLPGDTTAAFFKIMNNMPHYVNKASALINQLGTAFQSFDQSARGGRPQQTNDFAAFTPNYGMGNLGNLGNTTPKKKKRKTKRKTKR